MLSEVTDAEGHPVDLLRQATQYNQLSGVSCPSPTKRRPSMLEHLKQCPRPIATSCLTTATPRGAPPRRLRGPPWRGRRLANPSLAEPRQRWARLLPQGRNNHTKGPKKQLPRRRQHRAHRPGGRLWRARARMQTRGCRQPQTRSTNLSIHWAHPWGPRSSRTVTRLQIGPRRRQCHQQLCHPSGWKCLGVADPAGAAPAWRRRAGRGARRPAPRGTHPPSSARAPRGARARAPGAAAAVRARPRDRGRRPHRPPRNLPPR
mmetsp:Transcript_71713/g.232134  ORF Transcript_71713/g.232134 Transcript_71713/m.232134 type:complete len:261 (-) Transcript_71713:465-1247(-)